MYGYVHVKRLEGDSRFSGTRVTGSVLPHVGAAD